MAVKVMHDRGSGVKAQSWIAGGVGLVAGGIIFILVALAETESRLAQSGVSIDPLGGIVATSSKAPFWWSTAILAVVWLVAGAGLVALARSRPRTAAFAASGATIGIIVLTAIGGFDSAPMLAAVRQAPTLSPSVILGAAST